jgi:hypothetical protein
LQKRQRSAGTPSFAHWLAASSFNNFHWINLSVLLEWQTESIANRYSEPYWHFSRQAVHGELKQTPLSADGAPHLELAAQVKEVDLISKNVHLIP